MPNPDRSDLTQPLTRGTRWAVEYNWWAHRWHVTEVTPELLAVQAAMIVENNQ